MAGYPKGMWVIQNWSIGVADPSPYTPPEARGMVIMGVCPARPGFEHGITTSRIVRHEGRRIWTESGSRYVLGKPNPEYVALCKQKGWYVPTHKRPIGNRKLRKAA